VRRYRARSTSVTIGYRVFAKASHPAHVLFAAHAWITDPQHRTTPRLRRMRK